MLIAITGSHGLVGSALVPFFQERGHGVRRLVRGSAGEDEIAWNPSAEFPNARVFAGIDAFVHLAGENIATDRWTDEKKEKIRRSRVLGTGLLCEALARMESPPKVFLSASAVGYYGDRGDEILDESSSAGQGFLADVAREWEEATRPASAAGIRVVLMRFGMILSPRGGALAKMLTPFRLGAGGVIGSGRQYWSWIALDDVLSAIEHLLTISAIHGPVNVVSPHSATNREFTKTLGRVLSRPTLAFVPGFAARLVLGEMADSLLLTSVRVEPKQLVESGFVFQYPELEPALRHLLKR